MPNTELIVKVAQAHQQLRSLIAEIEIERNKEVDALFDPAASARMGEEVHTERLAQIESDNRLEQCRFKLEEGMRGLLACIAFPIDI